MEHIPQVSGCSGFPHLGVEVIGQLYCVEHTGLGK